MSSTQQTWRNMTSDPRVQELSRNAQNTLRSALALAAGVARDHSGTVHTLVDKAAVKVDQQTKGKYAHKVGKARQQAHQGVDRLSEWKPKTVTTEEKVTKPQA